MTLTQSTYDGVLYNTETIKDLLDGYVDNLHFDEAWLPHAAFHPVLRHISIRWAASATRPKHSVTYATQSHPQAAGGDQSGQPRAGAGQSGHASWTATCSTKPI